MTTILGIPGSLRAGSFNRQLLDAAAAIAPDGVTLDVFDRVAEIPVFNEDLEDEVPAAVNALREAAIAADALLFATPEYNRGMSGAVKNLVDWLSREGGVALKGKAVATIGATTGAWGTRAAQEQLRITLLACGAHVLPDPMVYVPRARDAFAEDGSLTDPRAAAMVTKLLAGLATHTAHVS